MVLSATDDVRSPDSGLSRVRGDFPILTTRVHDHPLVYLDSAATTQKPRQVLDALLGFYATGNANIHRGVHHLSEQATEAFETVRERARRFVNAGDRREIVFLRGATEGVNLVAGSWGRASVRRGDELMVSGMEHHSNLVPWQLLARETGATLRVIPVQEDGTLDLDGAARLIGPRTRLVAVTQISNVLGTINPVRQLADLAHDAGSLILVDGAQAAVHLPVDVRALGADFFVCSGHKMLGPTGSGLLYARSELLESMPPWQSGGGMIARVSWSRTTFAPIPHRFEAGTPAIAETIGLGAAMDYLSGLGFEAIMRHEADLVAYAHEQLRRLPGLRIFGTAPEKAGVVSFALEGCHPHDVGTILDREGVAVRAGHHCAQPLMERFGVPAMARASFCLYNTRQDVDALVQGLERVRKVMG